MIGYSDSDYTVCANSKKIYIRLHETVGWRSISWKSGKQSIVATFTMEAKFVVCFEGTIHALWLQNFIFSLDIVGNIARLLRIYCDNYVVVFFSKNETYSKGAKHMDLK